MGFSFIAVFQRSRNKGSGNGVKAVVGNVVEGEGCRPVRLSRFVVLTYSVRELPRFSPKSANFSKICNTHYRRGKHSKSFPWICDSAAVDNVTVNGGIITGRDY